MTCVRLIFSDTTNESWEFIMKECALTHSSSVFSRKIDEERAKNADAILCLHLEKCGVAKESTQCFLNLLSCTSSATMCYREFPCMKEESILSALPLVLHYECCGLLSMIKFQTALLCSSSSCSNSFPKDLKHLVDALLKCDKDRDWVTRYVLKCEIEYLCIDDDSSVEDVMERVQCRGGMDPFLFTTLILHAKDIHFLPTKEAMCS